MNASLLTVIPCAPNIHTLRLEAPLKFKPGQSVQIHFPGEQKKRFYSISSSPTEGAFIEITVKTETGSALAKAISALKKGDALDIEGPMGGSLSLPDALTETITFIAAGTGVTPFRSMIRQLIDERASIDFYLLHSVSTQSGLVFEADFRQWAEKSQRFHYIPTITRDFDNNWKNETGRIGEALIRKHVTAQPSMYLLCGPTSFVNDMEKLLKETLNIQSDHIRREKW